jgi:UDP-N-acetyl-D-mannosaminuronic acid dehydrogenase
LIDVETPVNDAHIPEYHALKGALNALGAVLKPGALVVVESTIMPGTMQKIVLPLLEAGSGGKCGQRFFLGNCPERVMPGKLLRNLQAMSRVVGGDSEETADTMRLLYKQIVGADVDAADWITAELVKTVENAYRDVQIAFANEVALICEALGADAWRVRELVRKSPGREMLLPGAGVGGHCIPKDPWLLASAVRDLDVDVRLIPTARAVNNSMPAHVLGLVQDALGSLSGRKVLVLGYAYLEDSDDTRNSPSATLVELLEKSGAHAVVYDPFVGQFSGDMYAKAQGCDAAVLMTAHGQYKAIDLAKIKSSMAGKIFVDCRNFWKNGEPAVAGFELIRLGDFSPRR